MLLFKSLLAWLVILTLAVANGIVRESVLVPALGRPVGLVLSGIILCLLVMLVAYGFVRAVRGLTARIAVRIGFVWLLLTLAFEFGFGRYVQQKSWAELFEAYAFRDGNIWPVVLLVILLAPPVAAALRARPARAGNGA